MAERLATLLAALVLALAAPGAALAQGAGDDQYSDPFGSGQNEQAEPEPEPSEPEPSVPESSTEPPTPEPAPATATASQQEPAAQEQLPYTGADEGLVALAGVVMLAGGIALRLRLAR